MSDKPSNAVFMDMAEFPANLRRDLTFTMRWERCPTDSIAYWCVGQKGAVEFVVTYSPRVPRTPWATDDYRGCFRVHRPDGEGEPTTAACEALSGKPCWTDGSFTLAQETWIPQWLWKPSDVGGIFADLQCEYETRLESLKS